jgi:hypothetical protein
MENSSTHRVVVTDHEGHPKVWPPIEVLSREDTLEISNVTEKEMEVIFPGTSPFVIPPLKADGTCWVSQVRDDATPGSYPYAVYLSRGNHREFAEGASAPHVIIRP